jgi:hypothetical protein
MPKRRAAEEAPAQQPRRTPRRRAAATTTTASDDDNELQQRAYWTRGPCARVHIATSGFTLPQRRYWQLFNTLEARTPPRTHARENKAHRKKETEAAECAFMCVRARVTLSLFRARRAARS